MCEFMMLFVLWLIMFVCMWMYMCMMLIVSWFDDVYNCMMLW